MPPKTLALTLFSAEEAEWLLPAAVEVAAAFRAHLVGLFPDYEVLPYATMEGTASLNAMAALTERRIEERAAVESRFAEATRLQDFVSELRVQEGHRAGAEGFLAGNARGADLVLAGQIGSGSAPVQRRLVEHLIRHSGRPVLVIPQGWEPGPVGRKVLLGWSDTREATRAAHDALAVAAPKAVIDILHAGTTGEEPETAYRQDMAAAFDRLGHKVTVLERDAPSGGAGQTLLSVAVERGADMIAVGAFGHSRAYDFVIGAVTQHLLENAEIPVLFSR
ncbi:MAG: universal stress protein [Pseudooceanicola sp.]